MQVTVEKERQIQAVITEIGDKLATVLQGAGVSTVNRKSRRDLVTEMDVWSEEQLTKGLYEIFPEVMMLGEEGSGNLSNQEGKSLAEILSQGKWWVVDPIDGTSNYVNQIPYFGVSVALVEDGRVVFGAVYDPIRKEYFKAKKGGGAYLNDVKIQIGDKSEMEDCIIATGFPYDRVENWAKYREAFEAVILSARCIRRFGAATLDACWVACGRFDAHFEYQLKPWDVAAASIIVQESGGAAGSFSHDHTELFCLTSETFLFANPKIYQEMRKRLPTG